MTLAAVMKRLQALGTAQTKKTLLRHGATEPLFGVKVQDLKTLLKELRGDHELALALYRTGNSDAMYLAGLLADPAQMSRDDLHEWAAAAPWPMISTTTVAGVAADSPHGWEVGRAWIDSDRDNVVNAGWATLSGVIATRPDSELDLPELRRLLKRVVKEIGHSSNAVRSTMNGWLISVGGYVTELTSTALQAAARLGRVEVDMGETACQVPDATAYIEKIRAMGRLGRKRKSARC